MIIKHVSRSGRRRLIPLRHHLLALSATASALLLILVGSTFYTTALHFAAGDSVNIDYLSWGNLTRKFLQDNHAAVVNTVLAREPATESDLPTFRLFVDPGEFAALDQEIIRFGLGELPVKPQIRGLLLTDEGGMLPAWVGYRGTNSWHHQYWKPSLQVRLRRGVRYEGYRRHTLVAPEDPVGMRNWLSVELARRFGMLTYEEDFARVFLNGHYLGLYNTIRPLDSSLLINTGRPPGPFFRAENLTGPVFRRRITHFERPEDWEIEGIDRLVGESILDSLLATVRNSGDAEGPEGLRERLAVLDRMVDRDQFARYLAVLCHASETHIDTHNFALWFDTTRGRLQPIPVDVNGYDWARPEPERLVLRAGNVVIALWQLDPRNLRAYTDRLWELIQGPGSEEATSRLIQETWQRIRPAARSDVNTSEMGARNRILMRTLFPITELDANVQELEAFARRRVAYIRQQMVTDLVLLTGQDESGFEVMVMGLSGVVARRTDGQPFRVGPGGVEDPVLTPSLSALLRLPYALYQLPGSPEEYVFTHRRTGRPVALQTRDLDAERFRAGAGIHPHTLRGSPPEEVVLSGEVEITEDRIVPPGGRLRVEPGTTLRMHPGASLLLRGAELVAVGTEEQPIRVEPADPDRPWGVIAAQEGGRIHLEHAEVQGGSRDTLEQVQYAGAICLRHASARIAHASFQDSYIDAADSSLELTDASFESIFGRHLFQQRCQVTEDGVTEQQLRPVHTADLLAGEGAGTPLRWEREHKLRLELADPPQAELEAMAEAFRDEVTWALRWPRDWRAPGRAGAAYRVDPDVAEFAFRDLYFDTPDRACRREGISYRLRERWRSLGSYERDVEGSPYATDDAHRLEFQAKVERRELGDGLSQVREARFEFRPESAPFGLDYLPPRPPWPLDLYIPWFQSGRFEGLRTAPARAVWEHLAAGGTEADELEFDPALVLVTLRFRQHLNLATPWGTGPNPEQVFIVTLDRVEVYPAEYVEISEAGKTMRPVGCFVELEVEFERNVSHRLDEEIELARQRGDEVAARDLRETRDAFGADQQRIMNLITAQLRRQGVGFAPSLESKYLQAWRLLEPAPQDQ